MILVGVLVMQAILLVTDELIFHRERGLPNWEKWSHPVDALSLAVSLAVPLFFPYEQAMPLFLLFCVLSSFLVTKDEWIHARLCNGPEQWLHALLFLVHPVVFVCVWAAWSSSPEFLHQVLVVQVPLVLFMALYQIAYWNFVRADK